MSTPQAGSAAFSGQRLEESALQKLGLATAWACLGPATSMLIAALACGRVGCPLIPGYGPLNLAALMVAILLFFYADRAVKAIRRGDPRPFNRVLIIGGLEIPLLGLASALAARTGETLLTTLAFSALAYSILASGWKHLTLLAEGALEGERAEKRRAKEARDREKEKAKKGKRKS